MLPGLGTPSVVRIGDDSAAVGKALAEINLDGSSGATVLALVRGDRGVIVPTTSEVLRPGDVLVLAGSQAAIQAARRSIE
jgi:CPA2 family monovalent cation:H+ antiporter-2